MAIDKDQLKMSNTHQNFDDLHHDPSVCVSHTIKLCASNWNYIKVKLICNEVIQIFIG
jgi:hypothetical protein